MIEHIDQNFGLHATLIPQLTPNMQVGKTDHFSYVKTGFSCDTFNIIHIHNHQSLPASALEYLVGCYREKNWDYCLWINQENLTIELKNTITSIGLNKQNEEVGMALNLANYELNSIDKDLTFAEVSSKSQLEEYANVVAANWTPADKNVVKFYKQTANHYLLGSANITLFVAYINGEPAGSVELFPTDTETVGIYGLCTLEKFRGKGVGSALMTTALNKAKRQGYHNVVLQATEDGIGIYEKIGFERHTTYFEFA